MKRFVPRTLLLACIASMISVLALPFANAEEPASPFSTQTIDIGVVVSDLEESMEFYSKVVGLKEAGGFKVSDKVAGDAGLTDSAALNIKIFSLGDEKTATKLKLVQVIDVESDTDENEFIEKKTGFSYITVHVHDMNAAMERLSEAGVKPIGKGPVALPEDLAPGVFLTVLRDPDGNFVELVGPKLSKETAICKGVLLLDGVPIEGATVTMSNKKGVATAITKADGSFSMMTIVGPHGFAGAPTGLLEVAIMKTAGNNDNVANDLATELNQIPTKHLLPEKYSSPKDSGLEIELPKRGIENLTIELTTK